MINEQGPNGRVARRFSGGGAIDGVRIAPPTHTPQRSPHASAREDNGLIA